MRRILTVSEIFYPEGGGAELATYLILKRLKRAGFNLTIVTGTRKPAVIRGAKYFKTNLLGNYNRILRFAKSLLLSREKWFMELLNEHDILYIPLYAYPLIPIAKRHGLKVIVHLHNYVPVRYYGIKYYFEPDKSSITREFKNAVVHEIMQNNSVFRVLFMPASYTLYRLSKIWLGEADRIICVSKRQAKIVMRSFPEIADKIQVIYNPLPQLPIIDKKLDDENPKLLYVGGKSYLKGYHVLLKALTILSKKHVQKMHRTIEISIVGPGFVHRRTLRLNNIILKILGYIPRRTLIKIYRKIHALIFPSICEESLPYAIVESMLTGTIPITSRIGGTPEIVEGTPAERFMFTPGNVDELVDRINLVLSMSKEQLTNIGYGLREAILKKFDDEIIKHKLLKVFDT